MTRLRRLRQEVGWTQFELARRSRVNAPDISMLELGRKIPPSDSITLRRLARALGWMGAPAALLDKVSDGGDAAA